MKRKKENTVPKHDVSSVVFRIATEKELPEILVLMNEWAWQQYQCKLPPLTGEIIVAWNDNKIVGTIALDFADEQTPFPLEALYDFEKVKQCLPQFRRDNTVQIGRWFAKIPGVSYTLSQVMTKYVQPLGVTFVIAEAKDLAIKRMEKLGMKPIVVHDILPDITKVPVEGQQYYKRPPFPKLLLIDTANITITPQTPTLTKGSS